MYDFSFSCFQLFLFFFYLNQTDLSAFVNTLVEWCHTTCFFYALPSWCRTALEQLHMFKCIEKRPMAWPCQLTIGSSLSIRIVGYKAVSWLGNYTTFLLCSFLEWSVAGEHILTSVMSELWTTCPHIFMPVLTFFAFKIRSVSGTLWHQLL